MGQNSRGERMWLLSGHMNDRFTDQKKKKPKG
jgi:hypothetical protein